MCLLQLETAARTELRRHGLAYLTEPGWRGVLSKAWEADVRECLAYWRFCDLPLIVTQQQCASDGKEVCLGIPAPIRWGRRRIALSAPISEVARLAPPPTLEHVRSRVGESRLRATTGLVEALERLAAPAHVFGSYAWQALTGLSYLHAHSDLDLVVTCDRPATADAVTNLLVQPVPETPRIDGELCFPDGQSVAWREWQSWRRGDVRSVLVKKLNGASLAEQIDDFFSDAGDAAKAKRAV